MDRCSQVRSFRPYAYCGPFKASLPYASCLFLHTVYLTSPTASFHPCHVHNGPPDLTGVDRLPIARRDPSSFTSRASFDIKPTTCCHSTGFHTVCGLYHLSLSMYFDTCKVQTNVIHRLVVFIFFRRLSGCKYAPTSEPHAFICASKLL